VNVVRGTAELDRLLREQTTDVRALDPPGFRRWIEAHLTRWQHDPVFAQRVRVRELRRAHPRVGELEAEARRAAKAYAATPESRRLAELHLELSGAAKAIAGLTSALERADADERAALQDKLADFRARHIQASAAKYTLEMFSPQRQALLRIGSELNQLRSSTGLAAEQYRLDALLAERGRRSGRAGGAFERLAQTATRRLVVPDLAPDPGRVRVLYGLTLGAARVELDQVVVRAPDEAEAPADVLAVIEVKRNVNDLAHGFRRRQEDLAWLTGETGRYNPAAHRTRQYPTGHFTRAAVGTDDGETCLLSPDSFRHFRRDPEAGLFLDRLYFITRPGPLWGLSTAALARVAHRLATDPATDRPAAELADWCRSLARPVEAPDVLRLYAATEERARHVLLVVPGSGGSR
jgi:hypothetical protein